MGKTNLGRVTFVPRGAYDNEASYKRLDVVEYEGSSYLFLKDSTGVTPAGDNIITMFLAKKGDNGKAFAYEDFTPEQLEALRGAKGEPGKGLTILGYYGTVDLLKAAVPTPEPGDAYGVGAAAPYNIYVYDGVTNDWVDNGTMSGGGGSGSDSSTVLIPSAILDLHNGSTSEEILAVVGGKQAFIDIVTKTKSGSLPIIQGGGTNIPCILSASNIDVDNNTYNIGFVACNLIGSVSNSSIAIELGLVGDVMSFEIMPAEAVLGYANQVVMPEAVFNLTSLATSDDIISSFGGIAKFNTIVNKIRRGDAIVCGSNSIVSAVVSVLLLDHVDENNLKFSISNTIGAVSTRMIITVSNSIFSAAIEETLCLTQNQLESDPSVGGTGTPASAEAVKVVNDKVNNNAPASIPDKVLSLSAGMPTFDSIGLAFGSIERIKDICNRLVNNPVLYLEVTNRYDEDYAGVIMIPAYAHTANVFKVINPTDGTFSPAYALSFTAKFPSGKIGYESYFGCSKNFLFQITGNNVHCIIEDIL